MKRFIALIVMIAVTFGIVATVSAEEYEVKRGDNLWNIAKEYDTTIEDLVRVNNLKTTIIQPKQTIIISTTYRVEKGDTLIDIGKEFDVTVEEIKEWNDLKLSLIVIGQELEIHDVDVGQEAKDKKEDKTVKNTKSTKQTSESAKDPEGQTISVTATAYTAKCDGCTGVTYTGIDLNSNPKAKVIAVDPNVIPLGSEVYVEGYGYATAADIGGAIKGNKIDLHVPTKDEAYSWGVRTVNVTVMEK